MLKIIRIDQQQDWEKQGYEGNWKLGTPICPDKKLLPFITPDFVRQQQVDDFHLRQVEIESGVKTIVATEELNVNALSWNGSAIGRYMFEANVDIIVESELGFYEVYIKAGTEEFISANIFLLNICEYVEPSAIGNYHLTEYSAEFEGGANQIPT